MTGRGAQWDVQDTQLTLRNISWPCLYLSGEEVTREEKHEHTPKMRET